VFKLCETRSRDSALNRYFSAFEFIEKVNGSTEVISITKSYVQVSNYLSDVRDAIGAIYVLGPTQPFP
jgi:hypothetical protein